MKDYASLTRTGPVKSPPRISFIGQEGVGKTTAASKCPSPFFICGEEGLRGEDFDDLKNYTVESWSDFLGVLDWLITTEHEYQSVVVDTLDSIEPLIHEHLCHRDGKAHIEDYGWGKGYNLAVEEFRNGLARLDVLNAKKNMFVVVNTHVTIRTFNNPLGDDYDRYEMNINKKLASAIRQWSDVVLFATYETYTHKEDKKSKAKGLGGDLRVVKTTYSAGWDAKNRYSLPESMPLDMTAILEAISSARPGDPQEIIAEISDLAKLLPEDKKTATREFVKKHKTNPVALSQVLNKIRVETKDLEQAEEGEKESK